MVDSVIEYSLDGGRTWQHGRTVEAQVADDKAALAGHRFVVRYQAIAEHGRTGAITTRVLLANDPRAVLNQLVESAPPGKAVTDQIS